MRERERFMVGWCVVKYGICYVGVFINVIIVNIGFRNVWIVFERSFCFFIFYVINIIYRIYVLMNVVDVNNGVSVS